MGLSSDLISQFVKATKDDKKQSTEATVYGTVVDQGGDMYVQLDGSDVITPVVSTVKMETGERVIVKIKDHSATVTGNLSMRSARDDDVEDIVDEITEIEILVADKASIEELNAELYCNFYFVINKAYIFTFLIESPNLACSDRHLIRLIKHWILLVEEDDIKYMRRYEKHISGKEIP